jgi:maltooligosyltrehalose trehalohydrolase
MGRPMTLAARTAWTPSFGAWVGPDGTVFRVWSPDRGHVDVIVEHSGGSSVRALARSPDGTFSAVLPDVRGGDRYRYRLDHDLVLPDPASRFQPEGVHGPSQVVDPRSFRWTDTRWTGLDPDDLVFYELHVGTFSPEGTFAGVTARLPALAALGITAIELMPVADFPGSRNWGYDGVALFAPARCYGTPDDLRHLVDTAHGFGLAVFLDVVYNHLGPDGAYLSAFSPYYFTEHHHTPWGAALNFDGDHSGMVREFFIENACHWVHEYHIDGLRLDATYAIADDGPRHFLAELTARVRESGPGRRVLVVAEDHRNFNWMLKPEGDGGWGVDAVWADAFHHQCRRLLAGDSEGYYRDYSGRTDDLATTIRQGWFYTGQFSE